MTTISVHTGQVAPQQADSVPSKVAFVAAVAAVPPITFLHFGASGAMEPAGWTISDYVVGVPNGVPLYGMTAGALAIGGSVLALAVRGRSGARTLRALLAVWAVAVIATAVFPTNVRGTPENLSSTIHLFAGAVVFAVLPLVGWLLTRSLDRAHRLRTTIGLRWASLVGGMLSAALILNRLPGVIGMPELMLPPGILQRTAGVALILLLAMAAVAVLGSDRQSVGSAA